MNKKELWGLSKLNNKEKIIFVKCGAFYKTYGEDSLIINNIFDYKLKNNEIGFPINTLFKVVSKLNRLGISVVVINSRDNIINYKSKLDNKYKEELNDSLKEYRITKEIEEFKKIIIIKVNNKQYSNMNINEFLKVYKEDKSYEESNNRNSIKCSNSK